MKKLLIKTIALVMALLFVFPATAYAEETSPNIDEIVESYDLNLTEEEAEEILANNAQTPAEPNATGLISSYNIAVSSDGGKLLVVAKTYGSVGVIKAGFTKITIQRRPLTGVSVWSNYIPYTDIYCDGSSYLYSKSLSVPSGYCYRATCVHYAKKNALSVQKIDNTSNVVAL